MILDKNILVINNSLFDKTLNYEKYFYSYNLNSGEIINKNSININCAKKLHSNAHKYKNDYIDQVSSMNKYFSNYNSKFKYSIFHLTDLSCKRTEFLNSFLFLCHLASIREIINLKKINFIELIDCPKEFLDSLKSFFNGNIKLNNSILILVKNKYLNFYKSITQIHFFIKLIIIYFFLYFFYKKKTFTFKNKVFFSSYPKNFDFNVHIKYGKLVDKNDTYILSLITDGIHQNLSIYNYFNYFIKLKRDKNFNNYVISDAFIKFKDILNFIPIIFNINKISNFYITDHNIDNINISNLLKYDLKLSLFRLPRLLTVAPSFERISNLINNQVDLYYYLFEYSFGRMFNNSFIDNPNVNRIGFQHGPSGHLKLICFISKNDFNQKLINNLNLPHSILVENESSFEIYNEGNYKNIHIMKLIYRLEYLKSINRIKKESTNHLITCGLHDGYLLFNEMLHTIRKEKSIIFFFKPHLKANNKKLIKLIKSYNLSNLFIANKHITEYLSFVDKVYFGYTSVGQEAEILGIDTKVIFSKIKINESIYCKKELFI